VRELVSDGTTILLTTQYLDEADRLADRIAVLDRGRLVAEGTPPELKRLVPGGRIRLEFADEHALAGAAAVLPDASRDDAALSLDVPSDGAFGSLRSVLDRLDAGRVDARALTIHTPDLDDVFFALTGHDAAAGAAVAEATKEVAR
jgi:ABC-2 type transport system ATP-binding protein